MSRAADYTIKGFLYQFHKSLLSILESPDGSIVTVEGIIEDIEIVTPGASEGGTPAPPMTTAIQCKYHEAIKSFSVSTIYEPLLLMMKHFHANPRENVKYILFVHYPTPPPPVSKADLQAALDSKNKELEKHVVVLRGRVDLDAFLSCFRMEPGPSFDDIGAQVAAELEKSGIPKDDVDTLAYPNAINMIAEISVKHDPKERTTTRQEFVAKLKQIRKTAISRWTLALRTKKQLQDARRKQLKTQLDKNSRCRYFVISAKSLEDYDEGIVVFVRDYIDKYHSKQAHTIPPVMCLCASSQESFQDVRLRLARRGVMFTDGYIGDRFDESRFFRDALQINYPRGAVKRDFSLRLLRWEDHGAILNRVKCDDLFVIGECNVAMLDTVDVNVEFLAVSSLKEVKYLLGVTSVVHE